MNIYVCPLKGTFCLFVGSTGFGTVLCLMAAVSYKQVGLI